MGMRQRAYSNPQEAAAPTALSATLADADSTSRVNRRIEQLRQRVLDLKASGQRQLSTGHGTFSMQERALLRESQRAGHMRPPESPAWVSADTAEQRPQPVMPRPAPAGFAAMSSKLSSRDPYPSSPTGYRFLGIADLASLTIAFYFQQLMLSHVLVKILAVFLCGTPVVWLMSLLYCSASGTDLPHGLFKVYGVLYRAPGAKVTEETSWLAGLIMNIVFLLGLFTFAVVLGIISEEIKTQVRDVKSGNYAILAQEHTLVLGWNSAAVPLLRQIALAKHNVPKPGAFENLGLGGPANKKSTARMCMAPVFEGPVVILADHPKEAMDAAVAGALCHQKHLQVLTREGAPHFLRDLEGVSAGQAKTVIVLQPDTAAEPFKNTAATVMALRTTRSHWHPSLQAADQTVVIQTAPELRPVPQTALSGSQKTRSHIDFLMLRVNTSSDIWRLMAQTAIQPGVANVYCAVVQQSRGSASLMIADMPDFDFVHKTYKQARHSFEEGIVVGYIDGYHREAHLNPKDSYVMAQGDRLVLLADNGLAPQQPAGMYTNSEFIGSMPAIELDDGDNSLSEDSHPGAMHASHGVADISKVPRSATPAEVSSRAAGHGCARGKRIVVVGWPGNISDLTDGLADFAPPGSQVTIISRGRPEDLPERHGTCTFHHVDGSTTTSDSYAAADLANADAVIIGDREGVGSKEADAHLLFALIQVQEHVMHVRRRRPLHVVSTVRHPETLVVADHIVREVGKGCITAELIDPDELVSGIITQVAANPDIGAVLSELVETSAGHEIYLRRPEHLGVPLNKVMPFGEVRPSSSPRAFFT